MDLKSCMTTVFILFLLLAAPGFSEEGIFDSKVYDIDYRGPETHSHRPPPNVSGGNTIGVRHGSFKKYPQSKRQTTRSAIKKEKKA